MKLEFEEFRESMLDKLYDSDSTVFILKTNSDDIISCDIRWRQGWGNNYYFYSDYFDKEVSIDEIKEIAIIEE
jgi:hypothetical protein